MREINTQFKQLMLKFIAKHEDESGIINAPNVLDVLDIQTKDYDDNYGYIGEHYIVKCRTMKIIYIGTSLNGIPEEQEETCLVNVNQFMKFLNKEKSITWLPQQEETNKA